MIMVQFLGIGLIRAGESFSLNLPDEVVSKITRRFYLCLTLLANLLPWLNCNNGMVET